MRLRQKHVSKEENGHTLPIDLFIEIFRRLSLKTIARCRCVSKLWSLILRRPDFTDLFMKISSAHPKLLFTFKLNGKWLFFSSHQPQYPNLYPNHENVSLLSANHHMYLPTRTGSCLVNGSVRGLLCTKYIWVADRYNYLKAMLYNPSTGQSIPLPKVRTGRTTARTYLGYDPINKQVNVLCMSLSRELRKAGEHQVLTLGTKELSWRKIECSLPHFPISDGISINGVLYYIAGQNKKTPKPNIVVCFDVMSKKFTFLDLALDKDVKWCSTLINYTGKLGVLRQHYYGVFSESSTSLELWVLDDVEKHRWLKKIYVLPPSWKYQVASRKLNIVGVTRDGEFVFAPFCLSDPFYVFYYNVEKNTIVRVRIHGIGPVSGQEIYTFIDHVEDLRLISA